MIESLVHNGVLFQEPFSSKGFDCIKGVDISLLAEEMLWKFAPYTLNPKFMNDSVFMSNAMTDIMSVLPSELQGMNFPNDFTDLFHKMNEARVVKNAVVKPMLDEKKARKEKYGFCMRNGIRTELSNFVCEGSRFFISRGELRGRWVSSPKAEDVEINASEDVPCTVEGHHWKNVELRQTDYVATYKINVGFGKAFIDKFVWISPNSEEKQTDNEHKYEKARKLILKMDEVENAVLHDVKSDNALKRENALITYVVLAYGIRIGNDLGEDNFRDKNVRGASTLKVENMILEDDFHLRLHFIGKDSVEYNESMKIDESVYAEFKKQLKNKKSDENVYLHADSVSVNKYLKSIYEGEITPKLFRTAKAGKLLATEIQKRKWENLDDKEFKNNLMECCLQTSLLLNHHKTVSDEMKDKAESSAEKKTESAKNTYEKTVNSINRKMKDLNDEENDYKFCLEGTFLEEKLKELQLKRNELNERLENARKVYDESLREIKFKTDALDVNLSTSLNAYSTPKLPISLCKYAKKNPSMIYSKTQLEKFKWALNVDEEYWKKYPNV